MNNAIMRKVDVTTSYQPLTSEKTVVSVTISCPPSNNGPVYFRGDDGSDVPWQPGEWHMLRRVDLAAFLVRGAVGDGVSIVGGTW